MIHTEAWFHRESLNLSKDKEALLEMLEREIITPEEFAIRWKRMFQGPNREGWLVRNERGFLVMTTEWMQAHSGQLAELQLLNKELRSVPFALGSPESGLLEWDRVQLWAAMAPGHVLRGLPGLKAKNPTEADFNAHFERVLTESRELARLAHIYRMEHPATP